MLSRGCKIRVTKSSAVKKQHPEVGSEGFLNSLYLIPTLKIGIGNAYFFKYGKENPCRVERRPFCIDLGMTNATKDILKKRKTKVEVLELLMVNQEHEIISLFPAYIDTDDCVPFISFKTEPLPYRRRGIYLSGLQDLRAIGIPNIRKAYISRDKKKSNGRSYLPIVDFEIVSHAENIVSSSIFEFKAWFNAMQSFVRPFLGSLESGVGLEENARYVVDSISQMMGFRHTLGLFELENERNDLAWDLELNDYPDYARDNAALQINHLQAIHRVFMERAESEIIRKLGRFQLNWRDLIRVALGKVPDGQDRRFSSEFRRYHPHAKDAGLIIRAYLVRSMLFNNIEYQVKKFANLRAFREINVPQISSNLRATAFTLRKEVPGSIAALDRLMKARGPLN